jgi:hypothetical protein
VTLEHVPIPWELNVLRSRNQEKQKSIVGASVMSAGSEKRLGPNRISEEKRSDPNRISDYADQLAAWAGGKQRDEPDPQPAMPTDELEDSFPAQPGHDDGLSAAPPAREDAHERAADEWQRWHDEGIRHRSEASGASSHEWAGDEACSDEEGAGGDTSVREAFGARMAGYEVDLQRLEQALLARRQAEADERVGRLPPASRLAPGFRSPDDARIDDPLLPHLPEHSYEPLPPMRKRTNHVGSVLGVLGACAVAAPIAYFVLNFDMANELVTAVRGWKPSTAETQTAAPPQPGPSYQLQSAVPAATAPRETSGTATAPASPAASPVLSPRAAPTAPRPLPAMGPEEIAMLLKLGDQFMSVGDVAAARVLFERAAEAGDARAALALGATYDPVVLTKLRARGIAPDADKANQWYQRARERGSPHAPAWLAQLSDG